MTLVKRRSVFGIKQEATPGTAETLTVTEAAYNVYDFEIVPDIDFDERDALGGFGTQRSTPGGRKGKATFKCDVAFDGAAVPTWANIILPACGLIKTGNVFTPKTQTPDTSGAAVKTATIGKWMNGKFSSIYGAMGTFKLVMPTGKIAYFEFEFEGLYGGESDVAVPTPTYPVAQKLRAAGGPMTFNAVAMCVESATFDVGNKLYLKQCSNTEQGYEFAIITNRTPKLTANPESKLVAQQDRMGIYLAGTEAIYSNTIPGPGDSEIVLLASQAQIMENKEGNRNDVAIDDMTLQFNSLLSTIDSDFSLTFTLD